MSLPLIAILLPLVGALKLTPVQQLTQRVDLASESRSTSIALNNAIYKFEQYEASGSSDLKDFLESPEIQKLYAVIRRWSYIEERLKISMANGASQQTQLFEDVQHNIASIKGLIGHALYRDNDERVSLNELEYSCPTLWRLKSSWRSIVHDGWLDCYSTIGEIYLNRQKLEDAKIIADKLIRSLPWIRSVLKMPDTEEPIEVLKAFIALTPEDRKHIALEVKGAWAFTEGIRGSFKLLIEDFMASESARKRQTILGRAKRVTEEILQQYSTEEFIVPSEIVASLSSINVEILRVKLFDEIKRETEIFLSGLHGFIKSGDDYLKEMKQYDLSTTLKTSFETLTAVLESGNELSWAQLHASELLEDTSGFHGLREAINIFENAIEKAKISKLEELEKLKRQTRSQQNKESSKSSSSSSRSQRSEKSKRAKANANARSNSYNETFDKPNSEKPLEDMTWASFLIDCLWNLILSGSVLSVVSVAGGHYIRASNVANKQPNRPSKIYSKPPNALAARRRLNSHSNNSLTSSILIPPPKFDQIDENEGVTASNWWNNMFEDSKIFWVECYAFTLSLLTYFGTAVLSVAVMIQAIFLTTNNKSTSSLSEFEFSEDSSAARKKNSNHNNSQNKRKSHSESTLHHDLIHEAEVHTSAHILRGGDFAAEFVQFDLTPESKPTKSKSSAHPKKKKSHNSSSKASSSKSTVKQEKPIIERSESTNSDEADKQEQTKEEVPSDSYKEVEASVEEKESESEDDSVSEKEKAPASVQPPIADLKIDTFYYDEDFPQEDEGEWIEASGRKGHHHQQTAAKKSPAPPTPSSSDRHYFQVREQRLQKELQRRKAYETAFLKGKLDHAPKGLKKVSPANNSNAKPVVGLSTLSANPVNRPPMSKNQILKEMLHSFPSLVSSKTAGDQTSDKKEAPVKNMTPEEHEKNRQQFMNMMYTLLDRHNQTVNKSQSQQSSNAPLNGHDDADTEHLSITDTENSDDHYHVEGDMMYSSDVTHLTASEEELNKFYSIMNAYYYYQATESLIPWNNQQSVSPDLAESPTQIDQFVNDTGIIPAAPSLEQVSSFENSLPMFMPPPLIPVTPAAVAEVNRVVHSSPPPPAPPLLIPPPALAGMPPLTPSPTHTGPFQLPPEFAALLPPIIPLGLPPMVFPPPFNLLPPLPLPATQSVYRSPTNLFEATRRQIEYYFSPTNLERDVYLRQLMDEEGFVPLEMIAKFPRMVQMNVPPETLLAAVRVSEHLEVKEPSEEDKRSSSEKIIEWTYIRCKENPTQWVLYPEEPSSSPLASSPPIQHHYSHQYPLQSSPTIQQH